MQGTIEQQAIFREPVAAGTQNPTEEYLALTQTPGRLDRAELETIYDRLNPVSPKFLDGEWSIHLLDTGHPAQAIATDGLPLIRTLFSLEETEKVRQIRFHGIDACAVIPDGEDKVDRFRYVNECTVAATNEYKPYYRDSGVLHFYLTRVGE
ncbi:uncharacterized protein BO72DRAFT_495755 [Aspergillus fijiensis CBS 313.89]|uniref:GXWXG domain-containing protein n=1 Tax=Aspergillus fijiensis CBS 313.89 TaxID=1448319 RepID=A0A8G1VZR6_9EURO|nr:uncharacterized protein BO72DRAFT_495755 [Aspergillus fijiensis CBS 313.89]RAK77823.1 hypothetical protein BO72DRAFT_495755 [Aspergillus fijiensis CBS 313.89]